MGKPAARITDMHTCPMVTGLVPHVGGPVVMGSPNVITGGLPQARVGDMLVCVGPPDVIAMGSSGVFVNGRPAARLGDQTAHGGVIVVGLPTVLIGEMGGGSAGGAASPADGAALAFAAAEAQIKTLVDAAKTGTPFCEVCFQKATAAAKAATAKMAAAKAPAPAAKKIAPAAKAPPAASALPPKKAADKNVVCELVSVKLQCSHGRQSGAEKVLMVVGNKADSASTWSAGALGITYKSTVANRGSDTISGTITAKGGCGNHPVWVISGANIAQGRGAQFRFDAVFEKPPQLSLFGLRNITPTVTCFEVDSCSGGPASYEIRSYPAGKLTLEVDPKDVLEKITTILKHLPIEEEKIERWKNDWFVGKLEANCGWVEDTSWQAYFQFAFSGKYDPLFSISYKGQLWGIPVPSWLTKWVKAGLFYQIGGAAGFAAEGTAKYWPYTGKTVWRDGSVTGSGKLLGGLSVELKLASSDVVEASLTCGSGFGVTATGEFADEVTAKLDFGFDALAGSAKIKALWGFVEFERSFELLDEYKTSATWQLFKD